MVEGQIESNESQEVNEAQKIGVDDLANIGPMKNEGSKVDIESFDKMEVTIVNAEVTQVPSNYTPFIKDNLGNDTEIHQKQWVLKVVSNPVETIETDNGKIEFKASEIFNLIQDDKGNLKGFPTGEGSNLRKFMDDLKIENIDKLENLKQVIQQIVGRKALVKTYKKGDNTYMKFRY